MKAYLYDAISKEYISPIEAQKNPLEGGYLLPANATWDFPPAPQADHTVIWTGTAWRQTPDYRGKKVWNDKDKNYYIVDYIGNLKVNEYIITDAQISELNSSPLKEVRIVSGQVTIYTREKTKQEKIAELEKKITKRNLRELELYNAGIITDPYAKNHIAEINRQIEEIRKQS